MSVYTQRNLFSLILTRVGFISLWWFSANLQYYFIQKYWILKHRIFPAFVICSKRFVSTTTNQRMRRDMCLCVVSANSLCVCRLSDKRRNCERYIKALSRWMMEWPACEHIYSGWWRKPVFYTQPNDCGCGPSDPHQHGISWCLWIFILFLSRVTR